MMPEENTDFDGWPKVKPRNNCAVYVAEKTAELKRSSGKSPLVKLLTREDFDKLLDEKKFKDGPYREPFGTGRYDPYCPYYQGYGLTKDGNVVYCEIHKTMQKKAIAKLNAEKSEKKKSEDKKVE